MVKPSREGSTVGLSVVRDSGGLAAAIEEAAQYDREVMVEAFVPGRELTVGILGEEPLAVGEIVPRHALFDYECKYTPGMSEEIFPARIPDLIAEEAREMAGLFPGGFPADRGRRALLSRGEHASGNDGHFADAAVGGGGGDGFSGTL